MNMIVQPETVDDIVWLVRHKFPSFGGGVCNRASNNPIEHGLQDQPAMFALGVDIKDVVKFVLKLAEQMASK